MYQVSVVMYFLLNSYF